MVILPDSSAWIAFLRGADTPARFAIRDAVSGGDDLVVTEPVVMELLAGSRTPVEQTELRGRLMALDLLSVGGLDAYEQAAEIYRVCRGVGETVRSLVDCLIAAVAIREDVPVLHDDRDFDSIARHSRLRVVDARSGS